VFEIGLDGTNDLSTVFCLCRRKDIKIMNKTYSDISNLTSQYQLDFISDYNTLLAEDKELFTGIFENKDNKTVKRRL